MSGWAISVESGSHVAVRWSGSYNTRTFVYQRLSTGSSPISSRPASTGAFTRSLAGSTRASRASASCVNYRIRTLHLTLRRERASNGWRHRAIARTLPAPDRFDARFSPVLYSSGCSHAGVAPPKGCHADSSGVLGLTVPGARALIHADLIAKCHQNSIVPVPVPAFACTSVVRRAAPAAIVWSSCSSR